MILNKSIEEDKGNAMYSADTIGDWFIAWADEKGEALSKTKLQKIVCYAQAHYIHQTGRALFSDRRMEAWKYGPVIVDLLNFTRETQEITVSSSFSWDEVDDDTSDFLVSVWNTYGMMRAGQLVELSHHEDFWAEAIGPEKEITISRLKELYAS